jgi:hypothetical protein
MVINSSQILACKNHKFILLIDKGSQILCLGIYEVLILITSIVEVSSHSQLLGRMLGRTEEAI